MREPGSGVVTAVKRAGKDATSLTVALDGGGEVTLSVPLPLYERLGKPGIGDPLPDAAVSELTYASEYRLACRHALRILEYGDNNARTLRDKLVRKGIAREIAADAVQRMVELGYIREAETARRLAVGYAKRNLWGEKKIVSALITKGYSKSDAEAAVTNAADAGEIDFAEVKKALIKRCRARGLEDEKIRATLWRYGFRPED